jgi:hypothetical protein
MCSTHLDRSRLQRLPVAVHRSRTGEFCSWLFILIISACAPISPLCALYIFVHSLCSISASWHRYTLSLTTSDIRWHWSVLSEMHICRCTEDVSLLCIDVCIRTAPCITGLYCYCYVCIAPCIAPYTFCIAERIARCIDVCIALCIAIKVLGIVHRDSTVSNGNDLKYRSKSG